LLLLLLLLGVSFLSTVANAGLGGVAGSCLVCNLRLPCSPAGCRYDRCAREPNRGYPQDRSPGHPSHPASEHVQRTVDNQFKRQSVLLYGSIMGLINTFTQTKAFIFLTSLMRASIFDRTTKQTRRRWNYPPTDTVQQRDYGQLGKHSTPTRHCCFASNIRHIPAMFGIFLWLHRYAWCPLSSTVHPYTVYVCAVPVQIILYGIVAYSSNIHTLFHTVSFIPYRYTYAFCNIHPGALDRL
jgi:hypothetical protein